LIEVKKQAVKLPVARIAMRDLMGALKKSSCRGWLREKSYARCQLNALSPEAVHPITGTCGSRTGMKRDMGTKIEPVQFTLDNCELANSRLIETCDNANYKFEIVLQIIIVALLGLELIGLLYGLKLTP
jgi:hypothetical protein